MEMEDGCETSLSLGLSLSTNLQRRLLKPRLPGPQIQQEPSLTLSLSEEIYAKETRLSSSHSTVSSFSTSNVKKEKMVEVAVGEEMEVHRGSSFRASDEEEEATARKKLRLTKDQSALLEDRFKEHTTLSPKQKQALSKQLNLRPRQIEVWFQNRRARTKLKQTEVDCDFLRRCCETLTEENRRLHKELQDLKALNFSAVPRPPPFFVQLPATTLTFCSACERIAGAGNGKASNRTDDAALPVGGMPTQHFFNPFAHSAACQL